ncbi:MAG: methionine biosynthesis protein MetW [Candidatus Melainabacteria bacterium RIFOXYA2_FULL_32_9]|nr:MAG: methionine biosynthesis protein MetW [Candidatus Melainabacteria bacterium RIFOXYA2_FULL_32_9]
MLDHYKTSKGLHLNYEIISDFIESGSKVLDLGCGAGELLNFLKDKNVNGRGIEIDEENVVSCIEKGLSVFQGDIDEGLKEFEDKSFDYVILNQTLQMTHKPDYVIQEMLRIGEKVVISFPNFAYWRVRFQLFFRGRMPKSSILPFEWYNTPNIHLLTIEDFKEYSRKRNITILDEIYTTRAALKENYIYKLFSNFLAEEVMFVISKSN